MKALRSAACCKMQLRFAVTETADGQSAGTRVNTNIGRDTAAYNASRIRFLRCIVAVMAVTA
ncbi:MAG TPA: hypothetical protein VMU05_20585 [Dongiaceae bacterium]|nr:hypothetical protein [Dongiaceae bacterium]